MDILNDELLYTENLSKNFQGITAVDKVNFKINKNEIRALIGPNGAGKTTFVSLLCGRIRASKGKVFFNGSDISNLPVYKRISSGIGYTFQITAIFSNLTVYENVALSIKNRRDKEKRSIIFEVLNKVGLLDRVSQRSGDLSYGHQRLLELAMGMAQRPKLLILDEPTNDLDLLTLNKLEEFLMDFKGCLILVSHDRYFMDKLTDHLFVFKGNGLIEDHYCNYSELRVKQNKEVKNKRKVLKNENQKNLQKITYAEKKEYKNLERQISKLEDEKNVIETSFKDSTMDYEMMMKKNKELDELNKRIDDKMLRWMELEEKME